MVAEGALQPSVHLGHSGVHPTFTAYVEGKPVKEVSQSDPTASLVIITNI